MRLRSVDRRTLVGATMVIMALGGLLIILSHFSRSALSKRPGANAAQAVNLDQLVRDLAGPEPFLGSIRLMDRLLLPNTRFITQGFGYAVVGGPTGGSGLRTRWFNWRVSRLRRASQKRSSAKATLMHLGTNAWPAIPALLDLAEVKQSPAWRDALEILIEIKAARHPGFRRLVATRGNVAKFVGDFSWSLRVTPSDFWGGQGMQQFALAYLAAGGPASKAAVPDLIQLVQSKADHETRAAALAVFGEIGPDAVAALPLLKQVLRDKDDWPDVRGRAARALPQISPRDPEVVSLLNEMLHEDRILVRVGAAGGLATLKAPPSELLPVLTNALNHKLASVRVAALESLSSMGAAALPIKSQITAQLQDQNQSVRQAACEALQNMESRNHGG
jgi:hypothetical protein